MSDTPRTTNGIYCSPELEAGLLGTMLVLGASGKYPEYLDELVQLPADTFTSWHFPLIYAAIQQVHESRQLVSAPTIRSHLDKLGVSRASERVAECLDAASQVMANWEHVRDELRRLAQLRRVDTVLGLQLAQLRAGVSDSEAWMLATRQALDGLLEVDHAKLDGWADSSGWDAILEPQPELPWFCLPLGLGPGFPVVFGGYGYSGKTVAAQSLVVQSSAGLPIWGMFGVERAMRWMHLDYEQGTHLTHQRYRRLVSGLGIVPRDLEPVDVRCLPHRYLTSEDCEKELTELTKGFDGLLIDSLLAGSPGVEENSSDVRHVTDMLRRVGERNQLVPLILDHARKSSKDEVGGAKQSLRGSSAKFDAASGVFIFNGAGKRAGCNVTSVSHEKARETGRLVDPFELAISDEMIGSDPRGGLIVSATSVVSGTETQSQRVKATQDRILEVLREHGPVPTRDALRELVGGRKEAVIGCLDLLIASNQVVVSKSGRAVSIGLNHES